MGHGDGQPIERDVRLGGLRFHYRVIGAAGPTVIVLHGIMGHAREWDTLTEALAPAARVVVLDQRGHGRTAWAGAYTAADMAGDLIALVEHLGAAPVSVIGHSMGGMAGLVAAARRPDLVERLVLVDIGPDALTSDFALHAPVWMSAMAEAVYPDVEACVDEWAAANPRARRDLLRNYATHCLVSGVDGLRYRFDAVGLAAFFTEGATEDELWLAVDQVLAPTLVVRGRHSPVLSAATAERMRRRLPRGSRIAVIDHGGHDLGVEQPEEVALAAAQFLSLTPQAGRPLEGATV